MTALWLAGFEAHTDVFDELEVRFALTTYYYLRKKRNLKGILADMRYYRETHGEENRRYFLDSGAFSLGLEGNAEKDDPDEYSEAYIEFVEKNLDVFDVVAELDLPQWVRDPDEGHAKILEYREKLLAVAGHKMMGVWHPEYGLDELEVMSKDTRYNLLGVTSKVLGDAQETNTQQIGEANRIVQMIKQWNPDKWVHGLGQTRIGSDQKYLKYDSIDSGSWLRTERFGATFVFRGNTIYSHNATGDKQLRKSQRSKYRAYYKKHGLDPDKVINDDVKESRKSAILAWRLMADRLWIMGRRKGLHRMFEGVLSSAGTNMSNFAKNRKKSTDGGAKGTSKTGKTGFSVRLVKPKGRGKRVTLSKERAQQAPVRSFDLNPMYTGGSKPRQPSVLDAVGNLLGSHNEVIPQVLELTSDRRHQENEQGRSDSIVRANQEPGGDPLHQSTGTVRCDLCEGTGEREWEEDHHVQVEPCPVCHGEGRVDVSLQPIAPPEKKKEKKGLQVLQGTRSDLVAEAVGMLPGRSCTSCVLNMDCPEAQDGAVCAYDSIFKGLSTRRTENIIPVMERLADANVERAMFSLMQEKAVAGGMTDHRVTNQLNETFKMLEKIHAIKSAHSRDASSASLMIKETGGKLTLEATGSAAKSGLLSSLFGAPSDDAIEADVSVVEETQG